jgi:hypothetical protein
MDGLHYIEAFIILDYTGRRVFTKYFNPGTLGEPGARSAWPHVQAQLEFEKTIKNKIVTPEGDGPVTTPEGDVLLCDGHIVVFHRDTELLFFTVGPAHENELVISTVQSTIIDSLAQVLKVQSGGFDKRLLLENFFLLMLVLDEVIEDGVVLETSVSGVTQEVAPYAIPDNQAASEAKKAFRQLNKYLKQNL